MSGGSPPLTPIVLGVKAATAAGAEPAEGKQPAVLVEREGATALRTGPPLSACSSQGWSTSKPGARNSTQVSQLPDPPAASQGIRRPEAREPQQDSPARGAWLGLSTEIHCPLLGQKDPICRSTPGMPVTARMGQGKRWKLEK